MQVKTIKTGSKGNCYLIINEKKESLILELGVEYRKVLTNLEGKVKCCAISHEHSDHLYKGNDERLDAFIPILKPKYNLLNYEYKYGDFKITPLQAFHDIECNAYLIKTDGKTVLFATDTYVIPSVKEKIDVFLVEINHIEKMIHDKLEKEPSYYLERALETHNSLERACDYFGNLGYKPQAIHVVHASMTEGNIDYDIVIKALKKYCDNVSFAIEGEKCDF